MKRNKDEETKLIKTVEQKQHATPNYRRPYGLLQKAGVSTAGMTPRDAWSAWNELRKEERAAKEKKPKAAKIPKIRKGQVPVPELSAWNRDMANNNSMFNRGNNTVDAYKSYADEINGWDISVKQKEKLIGQLKKKYDEKLSLDARYVPWTVSGPARYPAQKMNGIAERAMQKSVEISDWFKGVERSVKNSGRQYQEDRKTEAKRKEEEFYHLMKSMPNMGATTVATWLTPIAQYDPKRYAELYEKYDKEYHFRKNTNAAKLYEKVKTGEYTGKKPPKKLMESDSYNAYQKTIQSGERVFMKFTTKPKPQMIYALKKRGWHWNSLEEAWSIPAEKYDADFVKGIEERYKKYL